MIVWHAMCKHNGIMEDWSTGVLEQLVIRSIHYANPLLHYSIAPILQFGE
jgi:hypothetical protein